MKSEDDPITDDEWLLRRVWIDCFRPTKIPQISPRAFEPRRKNARQPDTDGISLYRADCMLDPLEVLSSMPPEKQQSHGIVRVSVCFLKSLGLTVVAKPDSQLKGHVVIPEINADDHDAEQRRFAPIRLRLAEEASKDENIVKRPEPMPA